MVSTLSLVFMLCSALIVFLFPSGLLIYLYRSEKISLKAAGVGALVFVFYLIRNYPGKMGWPTGLATAGSKPSGWLG
jgi:hypothetical protein